MALSGSTNYKDTAYTLCKDSLVLAGNSSFERTPSASTMDATRRCLNRLIKYLQSKKVNLWTQQEGVIVLDTGVATYQMADLNLSGADVGVVRSEVLIETTILVDEAASETVISITDTTGMAATDKIIIELDDGTRHETTIVSVNSSVQVTITDALPSEASETNVVYVYPITVNNTNQFHPIDIYNVRITDANDFERPLTELSREMYYALPLRNTQGLPTSYYVDQQLDYLNVSIYPVPDNIKGTLRFTYSKGIDDVDLLTDDLEFPQEWGNALLWTLAYQMAMFLGNEKKAQVIKPDAIQYLRDAMYFSQEFVDIQFINRIFE